jgi:hypothetical protein
MVDRQELKRLAVNVARSKESDNLRSCFRTWVVSERGQLFSSVRETRNLKDAWERWQRRIQDLKRLDGKSHVVATGPISTPGFAPCHGLMIRYSEDIRRSKREKTSSQVVLEVARSFWLFAKLRITSRPDIRSKTSYIGYDSLESRCG